MIDTRKYEGHTPAPWEEGEYTPSDEMIERFQNRELQGAVMQQGSNIMLAMIGLDGNGEKDRLLMADAPLLLEEVKRLNRFAHCAMNFMSKHDLHFQFLNEYGVFTAPGGGSISMFIPYSYKWDDETKVSSEPIQFTVRGEEE